MTSESLRVDVWNGLVWNSVVANLSSGWNNVSVSSYLVSVNFTIRFRDATTTGDAVQSSWQIDVSLLHLWTPSGEYTAEVEFTGSSNLQSWTRLVWQIDSAWDISQVTVAIQLYNFTLGAYATSGSGYISYFSSATPNTDELKSKTASLNSAQFKNSTGHWRIKIKGYKATVTQFLMRVDWIDLQVAYSSDGSSVSYGGWQWYTIKATSATGDPVPYAYISVYANGTSVSLRNGLDEASVANPGWVRLNAVGEYYLELRATYGSVQTFVLYASVGSVVGQKTVTQGAP
jgi:hypothetical protein